MILNQSCKVLKRWSLQLGKILGIQILPQTLFIVLTVVTSLLTHFLIYLSYSSQTIYCQLPNLRAHKQCHIPQGYEKLPTLYVVTPTYARHVQKAELTRLSHTLMLVPKIHWILVEDSRWSTPLVSRFVSRLKKEFNFHTMTHLHAPTPEAYKLKRGQPNWSKPKGIWQRNKALEWLRNNAANLDQDGVIYFADDDNTYDLELFNEMRFTKRVSVWPVAFVGGLLVEKPIVDPQTNRIESFNSMWESKRPFPFDMAGFAVSFRLLISNWQANFSAEQKIGYVESHFVGQLVKSWDDLEAKADKCSKVLVWHTQTKNPILHEERKLVKQSHSDMELR